MHQILKSHSGALRMVCSGLMSWGGFFARAAVHSWGPATDRGAHAQTPLPTQRGQMENRGTCGPSAHESSQVIFSPPTCKSFPGGGKGGLRAAKATPNIYQQTPPGQGIARELLRRRSLGDKSAVTSSGVPHSPPNRHLVTSPLRLVH